MSSSLVLDPNFHNTTQSTAMSKTQGNLAEAVVKATLTKVLEQNFQAVPNFAD
jgi:hypothetical protein